MGGMSRRATPPLTRRRALAALGAIGGGAVLAACSNGDDGPGAASTAGAGGDGTAAATGLAGRFEQASSCRLTPEMTEGPYYIDVDSIRRDIREDRSGQELRVGIRVLDSGCRPIIFDDGLVLTTTREDGAYLGLITFVVA